MPVSNSYTYTILPDPVGVNADSTLFAFDMNTSGDVVGNYFNGIDHQEHGFLYSGGTYITLDDPAGPTFPLGINAKGDVVGWVHDVTDQGNHAFLYSGGSYTTLKDLGNVGTFAEGINNSGEIVGYYQDASGVSGAVNHGFLYTGGTYITLDDPLASSGTVFSNANGTTALDINAKGQVVGYYYDSNSTVHGFLYDNGTYTTLDDPSASPGPGSGTFANGINDKGEIVGYFINNGSTYNFLYSHGTYTTLDIFRIPEGITNSGQIITDGGYSPGGYIFTPTGPVQHTPKAGLDNGVAVNDVLTAGRGEPSVTLDGWGMGNGAIHDHLVTADSSAPPVQDTPKADVALLRNYMASAFVAGSDGHGGTPIAAATSSDQPTIAPPPAH